MEGHKVQELNCLDDVGTKVSSKSNKYLSIGDKS
jgi:hypothetical protein